MRLLDHDTPHREQPAMIRVRFPGARTVSTEPVAGPSESRANATGFETSPICCAPAIRVSAMTASLTEIDYFDHAVLVIGTGEESGQRQATYALGRDRFCTAGLLRRAAVWTVRLAEPRTGPMIMSGTHP
jgi:hypothetical protein